jgi:hypothetical protein
LVHLLDGFRIAAARRNTPAGTIVFSRIAKRT